LNAEDLLAFQLKAAGLPEPVRQYCYAPPRRLRADFAWLRVPGLLVEVVGGVYSRRAHGSITGVLADIDRLNAATMAGWHMLRFTPDQVKVGEALAVVEKALHIYGIAK
jgi:very-short-patch-repair endonuclease